MHPFSPSQNTHAPDFPSDWSSRTASSASTMCSADVVCLSSRSAALYPLQLACLQCYGITVQLLEAHHGILAVPVDLIHTPEEGSSTRPLDISPLISLGKSTPAWRLQHLPPQLAQVSWSTYVSALIRDQSLRIRTDYAGRLMAVHITNIISINDIVFVAMGYWWWKTRHRCILRLARIAQELRC